MDSTTIPSVPFFNLDDPALTPPPGQKSNFINPDSRAFELYLTTGVCLPLILVFASLRFYAKIFIVGKKSWDDRECNLSYRLFDGVQIRPDS